MEESNKDQVQEQPISTIIKMKIPVEIEMPLPENRVFINTVTVKPAERKLTTLDIKFGELTDKNLE